MCPCHSFPTLPNDFEIEQCILTFNQHIRRSTDVLESQDESVGVARRPDEQQGQCNYDYFFYLKILNDKRLGDKCLILPAIKEICSPQSSSRMFVRVPWNVGTHARGKTRTVWTFPSNQLSAAATCGGEQRSSERTRAPKS